MKAEDAAPPQGPPPEQGPRLDSWKEIAAHFQRDVRTVRRWEATEGLPIHRHQHHARGSVYAFKSDLDAWWSGGRQRQPPPAAPVRPNVRRPLWIAIPAVLILGAGALYVGWRTGTRPNSSSAGPVRIVVLPFDSPKNDAAAEPLGDVVAGDVISKLGRLGPARLAVVAYTSATSYRGTGKRAGQIGRELQADYLVEGSLRRVDERLHVTVRLVAARDETLLEVWDYERPSATLPGLADEVADSVARTIGLSAVARRGGTALSARSIDPEAYQLYLRARYHLNRRTGRVPLARQYLEAAIARVPEFAPAHAALAEVYSRLARLRPITEPDAWARAEASARRALALDATLPAPRVVLATISLFRDWDWPAAEAEYRRAVEIDPHDQDACHGLATFLAATGRMDEAIVQRQRALDADPLNVTLICFLGTAYVFAHRYEDAIREFEKALELEPDFRRVVDGLADAYSRKGLDDQAAVQTTRLLMLQGSKPLADEFERLYRAQGYRVAERWLDQRRLERYNQNPSANAWNLAFTYARLGDKEAALRCLETAFATRDSGLLQMRVDPDVDSLRSDPRFQALLRRLGPGPTATATAIRSAGK
jgi:TolB-like protein/Flp pilus assembly protein TadD